MKKNNLYRGQLGMVLYNEGVNSNKKYVVGFKDIDRDDDIMGDKEYINELKLSLDEIIPLILTCFSVHEPKNEKSEIRKINEADFYREWYSQEIYASKNIRDRINTDPKAIVELPQDEDAGSRNTDKNFEFVACPETNSFYISHDYTEFQWKPTSLVTFTKICCFKDNHDRCVYPG